MFHDDSPCVQEVLTSGLSASSLARSARVRDDTSPEAPAQKLARPEHRGSCSGIGTDRCGMSCCSGGTNNACLYCSSIRGKLAARSAMPGAAHYGYRPMG